MTPLQVQILLHYQCRVTDYENGMGDHWNSKPVQDALLGFCKAGILKFNATPTPAGYQKSSYIPVHEAMSVYIDAVCSVPLPVEKQCWVMPS